MRKAKILGAIACTLFIMQSCNKSEPFKKNQTTDNARGKTVMVGEVTGTLATGTYQLVPKPSVVAGNPKSVGVINAELIDNKGIEQRVYTSSTVTNTSKQWTITSLGAGEYKIVNTNSNKAMTIYGGTPGDYYVVQVPYTGTNSQKWVITYEGSNNYRIKCKTDPTWGMHIEGGSLADGGRIRLKQYASQAANNGYFQLYWAAYRDNTVTNWFKRDITGAGGWIAADGGWSIPLSTGKSLWNFGDSHVDDYGLNVPGKVPCYYGFNRRSSAILQNNNNWTVASAVTLTSNVFMGSYWDSNPGPDHFNWPTTGFQLGDVVYVFCRTYVQGDPTVYPNYWGKLTVSTLSASSPRTYTQITQNLGTIKFGFGTIIKDGYVYLFGKRDKPGEDNLKDICAVRFEHSAAGIAGTWGFWNGINWTGTAATAVPVTTSDFFFMVNQVAANKYVMLSNYGTLATFNCSQPRELKARTSTNLTSWSTPKTIYTVNDRLNGASPFWYSTFAHSQYVTNGELLVTYSINGYQPCEAKCVSNNMDPNMYRPQAIRVPLKLLDTTW